MMRYQSQRLRCLMEESERALSDAAASTSVHQSRIAKHILGDVKIHRLWESRHAELIKPVSELSRRQPQVLALRQVEIQLVHRRAFVNYLRKNQITGLARDRLFALFYGSRETANAVIAEHRQYQLAVSSRVSVDHIISVMRDPVSGGLLQLYEDAYADYFELYCLMNTSDDADISEALRATTVTAWKRAMRIRDRVATARPEGITGDLDRQLQLARSGRYPVLNYMTG